MTKKFLLLAVLPLLMAATAEPPPPQRDMAGGSMVNRHPINLPLLDLKRMAQEQKGSKLDPAEDSATSYARPALRNVPPAASYRTLGDAAKAGVDPLHYLQPMSAAPTKDDTSGKYEMYYWAAGLVAFIVLAVVGFIYASRTPDAPEA